MSYAMGRRIYDVRTSKGCSQESLANSLGISRQRLSRIENGLSNISYEMIVRTAEFLAVPVTTFIIDNEDFDLKLCFRDMEAGKNIDASVDRIINILKTFHAHEQLYFKMKENSDET